ncbi:hypothetical protein OAW18_07835 [Alphaproteobacteria bacterium]|nr:hypothetical protein [Alphaproteobacteria bacterium]
MLIIKHRWHDLDQEKDAPLVDGAEIDIRIHNGELVAEHDPFKGGPKLTDWIAQFKGSFLIANVKEEGLVPHLVPMLASTSIKDYFILDESVPFIIKHCKTGNTNFGIRVSKWEPAIGALNIMQRLSPSPSWIWLDTFDEQLPANRQELLDLIAVGARICLVSPELHPDHCANDPTDAFMRDVNTVGIENFHAVCTKRPTFWFRYKKQFDVD